jgi:hypothetical protein
MNEGGEEEHGCPDRMGIAQQPAPVHVAHYLLDGVERTVHGRLVVHREHDAGHDLDGQHEAQNCAKRPQIVDVPRHREDPELVVHQPRDGQTCVDPAPNAGRRRVSRFVRHGPPYPILILVSELKA